MATWIRTRRALLDSRRLQPLPATLIIEGQRIVEVRTGDAPSELPGPDDTVVDVGEHLVTPAFVNGHTHLAMSALRGVGLDAMAGNIIEDLYFRIEALLTADDVRAFTRMGAAESLLAGVGAVWDHYYFGEAVAAGMADLGLTGVVAPTLQDLAGPGVGRLDAAFDATVALTDERWAERGIFAACGPHATDTVSDGLWRRIGALADAHGLPIHAHVAQSVEEFERSMSRHGRSPVAWLGELGVLEAGAGMLLVHGLYVTEADLARLAPGQNVLCYCPFSQLQFGFPAAVEGWWKAGIPFTVGTDCGASNDSMSVQQELRLLASGRAFAVAPSPAGVRFRAQGEMSEAHALDALRRQRRTEQRALAEPQTLLDTVWRVPGALHPELAVGELRGGARANICIWDAEDPAWWPRTSPSRALTMGDIGTPWGLMVDGRWIGERGDLRRSLLSGDDWREMRAEADGRLQALARRAGLPQWSRQLSGDRPSEGC